ncbi:MAG: SDR family NAD(P)-dependent oxidoreductase [Clostridia bacterium]|nr:SDR family NAD(P)-dependent oxidoreductase [Clostridia bacterium]
MRNWLQGNFVVLTGASGGIGRELCKLLVLRYGARVIGVGRNEEKMLSLQAELGVHAAAFSYRLFDVSDQGAWAAFKAYLHEQKIAPVLLINNAGAFPTFAKALDTDAETTERILKNNYLSAVYGVTALAPLLKGVGKKTPSVVNICSSAALCTVSGTAAYSASKAAMKGYTEALAMEEKDRLRVGIVYPGTTKTDLFRADEQTKDSALDIIATSAEKMAKKIARKIYKRKRRAVVGWDAKLMNITAKLMPVKGLFLIRGVMKASKSKVFTRVFDDKK